MSSSTEYEYMDEASIDGDLQCAICIKPLEDPQCTPCDHVFCQGCITKWIQRSNAWCPTCRQPLKVSELTQASRIVRNMLGKIRVRCVACGKVDLERSDFAGHFTNACPVVCLAIDIMCPWKGARGQLDNHLVHCNYQILRPVLTPLIAEHKQLKTKVAQQTADAEKYCGELQRLQGQLAQKTTNAEKDRGELQRLKRQLAQKKTNAEKDRGELQRLKRQLAQQTFDVEKYYSQIQQLKANEMHRRADIAQDTNEIQQLKEQVKHQQIQISELQNAQMMSEANIESGSATSIWSRLSDAGATLSSYLTARRYSIKRLTNRYYRRN